MIGSEFSENEIRRFHSPNLLDSLDSLDLHSILIGQISTNHLSKLLDTVRSQPPKLSIWLGVTHKTHICLDLQLTCNIGFQHLLCLRGDDVEDVSPHVHLNRISRHSPTGLVV